MSLQHAISELDPQSFAVRLRTAMRRAGPQPRGLSPQMVSTASKLSEATIHNFLHGRTLPSSAELTLLVAVLPELGYSSAREALLKEKGTSEGPLTFRMPLTLAKPAEVKAAPTAQPLAEYKKLVTRAMAEAKAPVLVEVTADPISQVRAIKETFGQALKRVREDDGIVLSDLAVLLGVDQKAIRNWEQDLHPPVRENYEALLDYFPDLRNAPEPASRDIPKPVGQALNPALNPATTPDPKKEEPVMTAKPTTTAPVGPQMLIRWSRLIQQDSYTKGDVKELLSLALSLGLSQADIVATFPES
jgi:transcriptional regulator with XRE-family HTH domain